MTQKHSKQLHNNSSFIKYIINVGNYRPKSSFLKSLNEAVDRKLSFLLSKCFDNFTTAFYRTVRILMNHAI